MLAMMILQCSTELVNSEIKRIAVVGAGAIGLYYGGRLAAAGEDVHFLLRSDYDAISENGLEAESVHGNFKLPQVQAYRDSHDIGPVDLVVVTWKATANCQLEKVLRPLLHENTRVLTLQNGLGNCEAIAAITGPERVLGGLCFVCINRIQPGLIRHSGGGKVSIGSWHPESNQYGKDITTRFKAAAIRASHVDQLEQAQWEKLVWNVPFNGLSVAKGGVTTDILLSDPECEAEIRALMMEIITTAKGLGLALDESLAQHNIELTRPMGAYRTSSMIDFVENREVEVGPIWEEPLKRAKSAGLAMPRLEQLLARIHNRLDQRSRQKGL